MVALSLIKSQVERVQLDQLGQSLPIGLWLPNGKRLTEYTLHSYTGGMDLTLGHLEDNNKTHKRRLNRIYSEFLAEVVKSIGGYELPQLCQMLDVNTFHLFEQMYLPDILSLLLNVRLVSYGSRIDINGMCPCPEQRILRAGQGLQASHDLRSVIVKKLPDSFKELPHFDVLLSNGITVTLEPPRFYQADDLKQDDSPTFLKLLFLCSQITDEIFDPLNLDDVCLLKKAAEWLELFGPDRDIEMDCQHPKCPLGGGIEWTSRLVIGETYEDFYASLLSAPRSDEEIGGTERYFNELGFFLSTGQDAPTKSVMEVRTYTPTSREQITNKLIEFYKSQEDARKEAESKAKSKSHSRRV